MPRLLLVDDNPSIHRIAESLLARTEVELVCTGSGAEALARLEAGERFDAALVDACMPGMDGWTLLARMRDLEQSAHLPVTLMAGVLDTVDPAQLAAAPAQGFLKKPIELRDLADRVRSLMATPVSGGAPLAAAGAEDDLLLLAEEDLLPEPEVPRDPSLDLEELDLSVLDGLTGSLPPLEGSGLELLDEAPPAGGGTLDEPLPAADALPELEPLPDLEALPDLEPLPELEALPEVEPPAEPAAAPPQDPSPEALEALLAHPDLLAALGRAALARLDAAVLRELAREVLADLARPRQDPPPAAP